jgi:hypothetical protein
MSQPCFTIPYREYKGEYVTSNEVKSPYTIKNLDAAVAHLERVVGDECAQSLFGQSYWFMRIQQALATPGIMHTQLRRLQRLLDRLESASPPSARTRRDPASPEGASTEVIHRPRTNGLFKICSKAL